MSLNTQCMHFTAFIKLIVVLWVFTMCVLHNSYNKYSINLLLRFLFISPKGSYTNPVKKNVRTNTFVFIFIVIHEKEDYIQVLSCDQMTERNNSRCLCMPLTFTEVLPYTKHNRV